ncbi:MAG: cation-efflux pump [Candidatus Bathycorpusculaceae bacterium]
MQNHAQGFQKLRVLKLSAIAIGSVVVVEASLGLIVGSLAILSDGFHALLDTITTLALFIATRASLKPPDEEHMYGHEKFESIGGLVGGILLVGVAVLIVFEAILKLLQNEGINQELKLVGFVAVGYTLCIDLFRVGIFRKTAHSESSTFQVGFLHAVADLGSTIIALLGFGLATLGFYGGDSLASVVLGAFLSYLSIRLAWKSAMELSDTVSKETAEKVRKEILRIRGVQSCENLRVRKAGSKTYVEATVQVPNHMSLEEAHVLASRIEENLKKTVGNVDTTIHIEPSEKETGAKQLVEKLAKEVEGVRETHDVSTIFVGGKLYITLHAYVDPRLSIQEAHKIAEKMENRMREKIEAENIAVHIEPYDEASKRPGLDENEMRRIVFKLSRDERDFRIKRIVTYVANEKRYVNVDCGFAKQISIEKAHRIASQIEREIKEQLPETTVTVHMEPIST